ncbi:hypothetical protein QBC41DRAFT_329750 [Cercophora samala]|uniref:F-box domain-containing protein n=1 Tax=Cercophora samala TaxID=330535 RepID=A0AA40D6P7_9PEZI|nr:hypothetical protein QBC41DRAFT_329750 [Cercophora samala]
MSQHPGPLERLPLHIAQYLSDFLHPDSILPFSLASKFCCLAAAPRRFASLTFNIRDKEKLDREVERLKKTLAVDNRFPHVRRVTLRGSLLCGTDHLGPNAVNGRFLSNGGWYELLSDNEGDSETEDVVDLTFFKPNKPKYDTQRKQEQNEAWQSFVDFMGQLSGLRDLVYACTHQIPPCVLKALHQDHPRCRLHMHAFSLRSLYLTGSSDHAMDPDEYALLTSPCLYSIYMRYEPYSEEAETSFNTDALNWLIANSASLRKFELEYKLPGDTLALRRGLDRPKYSWADFLKQASGGKSAEEESAKAPERYPLESLAFYSFGFDTRLNRIEKWRPLRSFANLRHLEISPCISMDVETLLSMATEGELCSLRSLSVEWGDTNNNLGLLLSALSQLDTLKLSGDLDESTFLGIYRGPRLALRKLQIYPHEAIEHSQVRKLLQWCPNLEDIRLHLYREAGPHETALYRLLGRLPRLRRVLLQFVCPRTQYPPPVRTIMDLRWDKYRDVRKTLVEIAVDETLARAIFRKIAARGCPLERLKIECLRVQHTVSNFTGFSASWEDIAEVVGGRTWVCTREDTKSPEVEVREITRESGNREMSMDLLERSRNREIRKLWERVWPPREGASDRWWENWWSYPLTDILDDDGEDMAGGAGPDL